MTLKECVGCGHRVYTQEEQPAICGECEICPKCGTQQAFRCSKKHQIFECEWCLHSFPSLEDLENDVRKYWRDKAKKILGLS